MQLLGDARVDQRAPPDRRARRRRTAAELVERIADRSDGNCLFIEELLRTWVSVGTLVREGSRWRLAVAADEISLPASVQSIYAAQLDDLPPDARRVARRASVAGRRFPVRALEPLDAADAGLEPLRRRDLLSGPLAEPLLGDSFAYRHALLRDAGYASLARAERARLHVRLARWLEQAAGEHGADIAEQIAGHYGAALESAPALAREIGDGLDREAVQRLAADWYERAGQGTLALSAHDAARELLRRSIDLTPDQARLEQARRWERLGDATAYAADMDEGGRAYERAIELYRGVAAEARAAFDRGSEGLAQAAEGFASGGSELQRQVGALGDVLGIEGLGDEVAAQFAEGAHGFRQGAVELREGGQQVEQALLAAELGLASATASLSNVWYQQLRFAEARELAAHTLGELTAPDSGAQARLLLAEAISALGASGPSAEIESTLERAVQLAAASGEPLLELRARARLEMLHAESGRGADWDSVSAEAFRLGDWREGVSAAINAAQSLIDEHSREVAPRLAEAYEIAVAHGLTEETGWIRYLEAEAGFVSGDWAAAREAGVRAIDLGEANAYYRLTVRTLHVLIPIAVVQGDRALLERAARWYKGLEGKFEFPDSPYSRVIRSAQDIELAAAGLWEPYVPEVGPRLASFDDDPSGPSWSAAVDRILRSWLDAGMVEGAAEALGVMRKAVERSVSISSLGRGSWRLLQARLAEAKSEASEAGEHARAALAEFRSVGAPWWMAKAIRLLERTGSANSELLAEVAGIERRLGSTAPTA